MTSVMTKTTLNKGDNVMKSLFRKILAVFLCAALCFQLTGPAAHAETIHRPASSEERSSTDEADLFRSGLLLPDDAQETGVFYPDDETDLIEDPALPRDAVTDPEGDISVFCEEAI